MVDEGWWWSVVTWLDGTFVLNGRVVIGARLIAAGGMFGIPFITGWLVYRGLAGWLFHATSDLFVRFVATSSRRVMMFWSSFSLLMMIHASHDIARVGSCMSC